MKVHLSPLTLLERLEDRRKHKFRKYTTRFLLTLRSLITGIVPSSTAQTHGVPNLSSSHLLPMRSNVAVVHDVHLLFVLGARFFGMEVSCSLVSFMLTGLTMRREL